MKKYSYFSLLLILMLATLWTSCTRKFGCYYSIQDQVRQIPSIEISTEYTNEDSPLLITTCTAN